MSALAIPSFARPYFDVVVVIPLEEEVDQFIEIFEMGDDHSTEVLFRTSVDSGDADLSVLMVRQEGMGKTYARNALAEVLNTFDVGVVVCLGIGGSLSDDLNLGDVCCSNKIFDVLDNAKASDDQEKNLLIEFSPNHFSTDRLLTAAFSFMRLKRELRPRFQQWQADRAAFAEQLAPDPVPGRNDRTEKLGAPAVKDGCIACALVTKSDNYNDKLKKVDRKVLVVETESGGIYEVAHAKGVPAITVRGISDHADNSKNKLEAGTAGNIRKIAAANAASFLKLQMSNPEFKSVLNKRRAAIGLGTAIDTGLPIARRPLAEMISEAVSAIDEKLRELSPEFRLQPKGYRLPVPRVRHVQLNNAIGEGSRGSPITMAEALEPRPAMLVQLSRTYPDNSLPWVIADDLLTKEVNGRQVMPVVINGDDLRPPNGGFAAMASHSIADIQDSDGIQVVYIIENVPISKKNRLNFLKQEMSKIPDAKFIFVTRDDAHLVDLTEFANEQKADNFELCPISFHEIAHFVQKNFSMSGSEAEVIALRLRETFKQFDLSAHPTYFAGIPKEVLSALLQANRRSELIQLAVDGFLTFLVADDKAEIRLGRTTRSRFLRMLVLQMDVEKRSFDQAQLVEFTTAFSKEHDFGIDPLKFVQLFVEQGILHFGSDGNVRFSLPFIAHYLLASELHRLPDVAKKHFAFDDENFDFATFDLYAEIGTSPAIVQEYMAYLERHIEALALPEGTEHVLLGDRIRPKMLEHPSRMEALQKRLRKAVDDVQNNKGDTKAKQRVIDVAEQVKEMAAKQAKDSVQPSGDEEPSEFTKRMDAAGQAWVIGTILLGCGAEDLNAMTKQTLSARLVSLGASFIHHWTESRLSIDFERMKSDMQKDENVQAFADFRKSEKKEDFEELRSLIGSLVDVMQFSLYSEPFRRVIDHLCEHARHRVLATSVEKAKFTNPVDQILHSAWLTDIESRRGKEALYAAIRALPNSVFLRTNLATHFLTRVHWNHWRKEDRLILLDAAEEAIKPLSIRFDKGGLKRVIDRAEKAAKAEKSEDPQAITG